MDTHYGVLDDVVEGRLKVWTGTGLCMFEYRRGCHELQTCGWWDKQIQTQLRIAKPEEE